VFNDDDGDFDEIALVADKSYAFYMTTRYKKKDKNRSELI